MTISKNIITDLGHLQLYGKTTQQYPMGDGCVYYIDKRFPIEVGPFYTIAEAVEHWKTVQSDIPVKYRKGGLDFIEPEGLSTLDNVIHVDFKAKKRIY